MCGWGAAARRLAPAPGPGGATAVARAVTFVFSIPRGLGVGGRSGPSRTSGQVVRLYYYSRRSNSAAHREFVGE